MIDRWLEIHIAAWHMQAHHKYVHIYIYICIWLYYTYIHIYLYMIIIFIFCILQGQPTMWVKHLWGDLEPVSGQHCFEPTLSGRSMIYTIHGFTAGVFTPPSGEQWRLRRTNNPEEHTLAGSQISLVAFRILCSLSKVPLKSSSP